MVTRISAEVERAVDKIYREFGESLEKIGEQDLTNVGELRFREAEIEVVFREKNGKYEPRLISASVKTPMFKDGPVPELVAKILSGKGALENGEIESAYALPVDEGACAIYGGRGSSVVKGLRAVGLKFLVPPIAKYRFCADQDDATRSLEFVGAAPSKEAAYLLAEVLYSTPCEQG
ncbi:MAG: hypothetical protein V1820_05290 [archaeon]